MHALQRAGAGARVGENAAARYVPLKYLYQKNRDFEPVFLEHFLRDFIKPIAGKETAIMAAVLDVVLSLIEDEKEAAARASAGGAPASFRGVSGRAVRSTYFDQGCLSLASLRPTLTLTLPPYIRWGSGLRSCAWSQATRSQCSKQSK